MDSAGRRIGGLVPGTALVVAVAGLTLWGTAPAALAAPSSNGRKPRVRAG